MTALVCVETDLDVHTLTRNGIPRRNTIPAVIRWQPDDPWAVTLAIQDSPVWVFGWELLVVAVSTAAAAGNEHGDIQLRRRGRMIEIRLSSHAGSATLHIDAMDLIAFTAAVRPRQHRAAAAASAAGLRALLDGTTEETP